MEHGGIKYYSHGTPYRRRDNRWPNRLLVWGFGGQDRIGAADERIESSCCCFLLFLCCVPVQPSIIIIITHHPSIHPTIPMISCHSPTPPTIHPSHAYEVSTVLPIRYSILPFPPILGTSIPLYRPYSTEQNRTAPPSTLWIGIVRSRAPGPSCCCCCCCHGMLHRCCGVTHPRPSNPVAASSMPLILCRRWVVSWLSIVIELINPSINPSISSARGQRLV